MEATYCGSSEFRDPLHGFLLVSGIEAEPDEVSPQYFPTTLNLCPLGTCNTAEMDTLRSLGIYFSTSRHPAARPSAPRPHFACQVSLLQIHSSWKIWFGPFLKFSEPFPSHSKVVLMCQSQIANLRTPVSHGGPTLKPFKPFRSL
jgi:hypothetical protein